jgi:hypothetical protein
LEVSSSFDELREQADKPHCICRDLCNFSTVLSDFLSKSKYPTSNQQPATSNQQPATSNQQPAISNQQPAISNQQPAISNQ